MLIPTVDWVIEWARVLHGLNAPQGFMLIPTFIAKFSALHQPSQS